MKVLVTGAAGFVGRHVIDSLTRAGHQVTGTVRPGRPVPAEGSELIEADEQTDFRPLLEGQEALVHAAGVAHTPTRDPEALNRLFLAGNLDWTRNLASAVAASEVGVMIHLSSIAAAGRVDHPDEGGFREEDESAPETAYGRSKREAEPFVTGLENAGKLGVNLRPPLIYGRGTKGNWAKLAALAGSPAPIPFASVKNRRSYLGIDNLTDLIAAILDKADRPDLSGTYHVADRGVYSLPEVVEALRRGLGRKPRLVPFPASWLKAGLCAAGKRKMAEGLLEDLILNTGKVETAFGWAPRISTLDGMAASVTPIPD